MSNFQEFKAYGVRWGAGHDWQALPDADNDRIEDIVEKTEAPAYVIVHLDEALGVRLGLADSAPTHTSTISMPAVLLSKIETPENNYIVLASLDDGGVYKMRVQNSNIYEDRVYPPDQAENIIKDAFSSGYTVFCDSRIAEQDIPDDSGEARAFEMKKVVSKKNSLKAFRYHTPGKSGWAKNLFLLSVLLVGLFLLADITGLTSWLTKDNPTPVSTKTVAKSKEQIEREITEAMKSAVAQSLATDTGHPNTNHVSVKCNDFRIQMPVSVFGWSPDHFVCNYQTFSGQYRRTRGAAPFDEMIALVEKDPRIPKDSVKNVSPERLIITRKIGIPADPPMQRYELPTMKQVMEKLYHFAQTRGDLRYLVEVKDLGMKPLNIVYEKRSMTVRRDLNYGVFSLKARNYPVADIHAVFKLLDERAANIKSFKFNPDRTIDITVEFFYI